MEWITVKKYALKKVSSTWMKKNHSPKAINPKNKIKSGARVDPLSTYALPKIPHGYFNEEGKTMALGMGIH